MVAFRWTVPSLLLTALLAIALAAPASASNALFTCTKDWSGVFVCDQALTVGQHVQLNTVPGACHVNINQLRTGRSGVKLADVTIAHNLNCPWATGSVQTVTYSAPTSPAVGGIMGLLDDPDPAPASRTNVSGAWASILPMAAAIAAAAVTIGVAARLRRRQV